MKTEQEQLEFTLKQKEIAKIHADFVSGIVDQSTEENKQKILESQEKTISDMQQLVYAYIGPDFHQHMKDKE